MQPRIVSLDYSLVDQAYLKDSLHFDFVRTYGGPSHITDSLLVLPPGDTADTAWIHFLPSERERWLSRLYVERYRQLMEKGLKVVYAFDEVRPLQGFADATEGFFDYDADSLHVAHFVDKIGSSTYTILPDTLFGGYAHAIRVDSSSTAGMTLVVGRMGYVADGLGLYAFDTMTNKVIGDVGARRHSLAIAIRFLPKFLPQTLPDTTQLAELRLYAREPMWQKDSSVDCRCFFYVPVDTVRITKGMYDSIAIHAPWAMGTAFRDIIHTFSFSRDTLYGAGDTNRRFEPSTSLFDETHAHVPIGADSVCAAKLDSLKAAGLTPADAFMHTQAEDYANIDFYFRFYTTRRVPLDFAGARISPYLLTQVMRGDADSAIRHAATSFYADTNLRSLLWRFDMTNEVKFGRYVANRLVTSRLQKILLEVDSTDTRGLYANPQESAAWHRVTGGDLDTTATKMVHMVVEQHFGFNAGISVDDPILNPCPLANPDSMDTRALYTFWRARDDMPLDTVVTDEFRDTNDSVIWRITDSMTAAKEYRSSAPRLIAYNNQDDYDRFTQGTQGMALAVLRNMESFADAARSTFTHVRSRPHPVLTMVQVTGFLNTTGSDFERRWRNWSIPHPTWITTHAWCAIASGLDGIVFSDFAFDGTGEFGVRHWISGERGQEYYDSLSLHDPMLETNWATRRWYLPRMWVGFRSRSEAIARFMSELRSDTIDLESVYTTLDRTVVRRHLRLDSSSVSDILPVRSIRVGRAQRHARGPAGVYLLDSAGGAPLLVPTDSNDMIVSWHRPRDPGDQSNYLTFVNLRQWPVDTLHYGDRYQAWAPSGSDTVGFGAIDVRRPYIVPRRFGGIVCDSLLVQCVGHEDSFSVRVAADSGVWLPWLAPGWGEMIRLTPIPRGVSSLGVAYNNAARAQNPSTDTLSRSTITVYERDSIVYLRLKYPDGSWSDELLVSDPNDTLSTSRAWNVSPAVAIPAVDTASSALIVWERRVPVPGQNPLSSILAKHYPTRPDSGSLPTATVMELDSAVQVSHAVLRTPAVVGTDSGYAVAWGSPLNGIEMVAIRDTVLPTNGWSNYVSTVSTTVAPNVPVRMPPNQAYTLDSLSLFPSMAYVRNYQMVFGPPLTHDVYLVWQQGGGSSGVGPFIFFQPIRTRFSPGVKPSLITSAAIEHVTRGLAGCRFYHPCIAADTLRVAVAFDSPQRMYWRWDPALVDIPPHVVSLRFRDSLTTTGQSLQRWNTPAYTWGKWGKNLLYPSVVGFPNVPKTTLRSAIPGGLAWYSPDSDDLLYLYRYGDGGLETSLRGVDPSMTRSPYTAASDAWSSTGILKRAPAGDAFVAASPFGYDAAYFAAELINTPMNPSPLFTDDDRRRGGILSHFTLARLDSSLFEDCEIPALFGGVYDPDGFDDPTGDDDLFIGDGPLVTAMGPLFFAEPDSGTTIVDSIGLVGRVARTGCFPAVDGGVTVMWGLQRNDALIAMLDDAPYDSLLDDSATVLVALQLVRASDDSLLWEGGQVDIRALTTEPVAYNTEIAADSIAGADTIVYARLGLYVSPGVEMETTTGYQFIDKPDTYFPRRVPNTIDADCREARFTLSVSPNPTRGEYARITLRDDDVDEAGASLMLYDVRGNAVADLGTMTVRNGVGSGVLNVGPLRPGVYTIMARLQTRTANARVTVVR